ncbi:MAG: membrane protein insertion efficiency factor YidD [Oscillospiraceae bacterium]
MKYILLFLIKLYQKYISPLKTKNSCIYYPTCSSYSYQAVKKFGFLKGSYLMIRRILRCHPFKVSKYDPVPKKFYFSYKKIIKEQNIENNNNEN